MKSGRIWGSMGSSEVGKADRRIEGIGELGNRGKGGGHWEPHADEMD